MYGWNFYSKLCLATERHWCNMLSLYGWSFYSKLCSATERHWYKTHYRCMGETSIQNYAWPLKWCWCSIDYFRCVGETSIRNYAWPLNAVNESLHDIWQVSVNSASSVQDCMKSVHALSTPLFNPCQCWFSCVKSGLPTDSEWQRVQCMHLATSASMSANII